MNFCDFLARLSLLGTEGVKGGGGGGDVVDFELWITEKKKKKKGHRGQLDIWRVTGGGGGGGKRREDRLFKRSDIMLQREIFDV